MAATATIDTAPDPAGESPLQHPLESSLSTGRSWRNRLASAWMIASLIVAAIPLLAVLGILVVKGFSLVASLDWWSKPIPDGLGNVTQWAVIILGVLLVGDALLGKLAVKA